MKRETIEYALMTFTVLLILLILYVFTMNGSKQKIMTGTSPKFSVSSNVLQQQFSADEQIATLTYLDKVLAVDGVVRSVHKDGKGSYTIVLGDTISNVVIQCAVDQLYNDEVAGIRNGSVATLKGICKGFNTGKLAGLNVVLSGCSIYR